MAPWSNWFPGYFCDSPNLIGPVEVGQPGVIPQQGGRMSCCRECGVGQKVAAPYRSRRAFCSTTDDPGYRQPAVGIGIRANPFFYFINLLDYNYRMEMIPMAKDPIVIDLGKRVPSGAFRLSDDAIKRITTQRSGMYHPPVKKN